MCARNMVGSIPIHLLWLLYVKRVNSWWLIIILEFCIIDINLELVCHAFNQLNGKLSTVKSAGLWMSDHGDFICANVSTSESCVRRPWHSFWQLSHERASIYCGCNWCNWADWIRELASIGDVQVWNLKLIRSFWWDVKLSWCIIIDRLYIC